MSFKSDFVWGAATASYQVEGAAYEGGKGLSIWDTACENGHFVFDRHTAKVGCDGYHRFREDIAIMRETGLKAYRFSLSWPRLIPQGTGALNPEGVRYYNELIDALLSAGIEPFITLYHWDMPYALFLQGGWLNPASPKWFEAYAEQAAKLFSDRVRHFITVNEPQCFIGCGLSEASHAPFISYPPEEALLAWHHALLANGLATRAIRAHARGKVSVGPTVATDVLMPCCEEQSEYVARANFTLQGPNFFNNALFTDPVVFGRYPEDVAGQFGANFTYDPKEMEIVKCDPDFIGLNIYHGKYVIPDGKGGVKDAPRGMNTHFTDMRWTFSPESLYYGPKAFWERYHLPVYITENGVAVTEWPSADGKLHDPARIEYIRQYLLQLRRAADEGADIAGYFYWSLLDNFEWKEGFSKRFGIVYVDFDTQERIPKDSAAYYASVIRSNGKDL